jgi:peptidyl-dipeptidase Dcp
VLDLAKLRAERAALMGYPNYAAYSLEDQTAKTPPPSTRCWASWPSRPSSMRAVKRTIQKVIDAEKGGFQIGAADWAFYTDKVRASATALTKINSSLTWN